MHFELPASVRDKEFSENSGYSGAKILSLRVSVADNYSEKVGAAIMKLLSGESGGAGPQGADARTVTIDVDARQDAGATTDYALVVNIDYEAGTGEIVYNGPAGPVSRLLNQHGAEDFANSLRKLRDIDATLTDDQRLQLGPL